MIFKFNFSLFLHSIVNSRLCYDLEFLKDNSKLMYDNFLNHCFYLEDGLKTADFISDIILSFSLKMFDNMKETNVP